MVFYFSGTGNSQLVAMQIAKGIGDEIVSINDYLKKKKKADLHSERPLVFVAPTYAWRMPKVVEQWICASSFKGNRDVYFVLTCGGSCGNAGAYARKLCEKKDWRYRGLAQIIMPENYLAMFPTPGEEECKAIVEEAGPRIHEIAKQIGAGRPLPEPPVSIGGRLQSGPVNPLFYTFAVHDKGFTVSEKCISCGKCAMRCPLNNIELVDGKPEWRGKCTHCMACIGGCPTGAIEYKSGSKGRHRHYIMEDSPACMENSRACEDRDLSRGIGE